MNRSIFGVLVAATLLAACAGSQSIPVTAPVAGPDGSALKAHMRTFSFTGAQQTFKVPKGVKSIAVDAYGGGTESSLPRGKAEHAFGGRTQATLPVTPRETLYVFVGGDGTSGFNGGGTSGGSECFVADPGFGGGASDVREHGNGLGNRILIAGGGGGNEGERGGYGGGLIGGTGGGGNVGKSGHGGTGGTQSAGGAGGAGGKYYGVAGSPGTLGVGGIGGAGNPSYGIICCGGGGGGYYGGGGGGSSSVSEGSGGGGFGGAWGRIVVHRAGREERHANARLYNRDRKRDGDR